MSRSIHPYGEASNCPAEIKIDIRQATKRIGGLIARPKS
jgi:hypothetical protein